MASSQSETTVVACPGCGSKLAVPIKMIGQRARCAACSQAFTITLPSSLQPPAKKQAAIKRPITAASAEQPPEPEPASPFPDPPEYVGFECRVCSARLYALTSAVGKKLKCGECGALNEIPPPPPPKGPNLPAALEGDQYELWEADEQPLPSQLAAAQPKFVTVVCSKCNTAMHPTINRVGQQITCPDCGHREVIPPPPKPKAKKDVVAADAPELDPRSAPADRPYVPMPVSGMLYDDEREQEYQRALDKARRTGKPLEIDHRGRPIMPRYPLITGVLPFLFSRGVPLVYLGIALSYMFGAYVLLQGIAVSAAGYGALSGMPLFAIGCALLMFATAFTYSCVLQIVMESSEGNRVVHHWPGFTDWLGSLLWAGVAIPFSAVPGWALGQIPAIAENTYARALVTDISVIIFLPIIMLSQLDINSPAGILSGRILKSLVRCAFSWLLFYFLIILLDLACGEATYLVLQRAPNWMLWLAFIFALAVILYARLLGRLAWRLAEAMPIEE